MDQIEKIDQVKQAIEGKFDLSMASSHPNNVEFTSIEADKGAALIRYQQMMNLQFDEIFAFGDGGNDLAQFKVATTSVAMGNAPSYDSATGRYRNQNKRRKRLRLCSPIFILIQG